MKFDIVVGNPPYGSDIKGSSRFLHYKIMKTALEYCSSKLCFIMPSKPITKQLDEHWYSMFKNAVCNNIEVMDKYVFKGTNMDNTAIYYCDVNDEPENYDRKLDVDDKIYYILPYAGKLFIDKISNFKPIKIFIQIRNKSKETFDKVIYNTKDDCYYLNVNRANGALGAKWISPVLEKEGIKTKYEEIEFCKKHSSTKNILECPNKKYGENLKYLMLNGNVLKYSLWLTQTNQSIVQYQFKYVPDIDYTNIHNDSELLYACGFDDDEIKNILNYLSKFDFSQNRNDIVRETPVDPEPYPSTSE